MAPLTEKEGQGPHSGGKGLGESELGFCTFSISEHLVSFLRGLKGMLLPG